MNHRHIEKFLTTLASALLLLTVLGCERKASVPQPAASSVVQSGGQLRLSGSSTMAPLIQAIADRYVKLHPEVKISIQTGGSIKGLEDIRLGRAEIGMTAKTMVASNDYYAVAIARDGGGILVHRDNPVRGLSDEQVRAIFTGKIKNWHEVGGTSAPIFVIDRDAKRGIRELFLNYFQLTSESIRADAVAGDNAETTPLLSQHPNGLVFFSVGEGERRAEQGEAIRFLPVNTQAASRKTLQDGIYPITRPLTLVTWGRASRIASDFMLYAHSPAVFDILNKYDFVPYFD